MRFKDGYEFRTICGANVLTATGGKTADMRKIINLNPTATVIYQAMKDRDFDEKDVAELLVSTYGINSEKAESDSKKFCQSLLEADIVE